MFNGYDFGVAIVDDLGMVSERFKSFLQNVVTAINNNETAIANTQPLIGTGTPEGTAIAEVGRWYVDTNATIGAGIYFKETGSGDTGWVLRS